MPNLFYTKKNYLLNHQVNCVLVQYYQSEYSLGRLERVAAGAFDLPVIKTFESGK